MKLALLILALTAVPDAREQWIRQARAAHAQADGAVAHHDEARARDALMRFLSLRPPSSLRDDDVRAVSQDAWFHLASVELTFAHPEAAQRDADQGLALGRSDDLFSANLFVIRGRARELLKDDRGAISDYQEAMRINEALLHAAEGK